MKTILFVLFMICTIGTCYAYRAPDSCLKRMYDDNGEECQPNPDSVRIDSCIASPTFGLLYAKKRFKIIFQNHKIMYYGNDTLFGIGYHKTWQDILPQFTAIKSKFAQLELLYGTYTILRFLGTVDYRDTVESSVMSKEYFLEFDNYVPIDSVVALLRTIPDIHISRYMQYFRFTPTGIREKESGSTKTYMIGTQSFVVPLSQQFENIIIYDLTGNEVYQCSAITTIIDEPKGISKGLYWVRFGSTILPYFYSH